jgi:hypothetical protein
MDRKLKNIGSKILETRDKWKYLNQMSLNVVQNLINSKLKAEWCTYASFDRPEEFKSLGDSDYRKIYHDEIIPQASRLRKLLDQMSNLLRSWKVNINDLEEYQLAEQKKARLPASRTIDRFTIPVDVSNLLRLEKELHKMYDDELRLKEELFKSASCCPKNEILFKQSTIYTPQLPAVSNRQQSINCLSAWEFEGNLNESDEEELKLIWNI